MASENKSEAMLMNAVILHTDTGAHTLNLKLAATFMMRFKGLMLSAPLQSDQCLLITRCSSVHTAFMRCAIDVIYLDKTGRVLKCVPDLKPWRGSFGNIGKEEHGSARAAHTLELAAGTIARLNIRPGDWLECLLWQSAGVKPIPAPSLTDTDRTDVPAVEDVERLVSPSVDYVTILRQRGSAMIEFAVVGPIISLLGLAILQYGMLFFAKNQINHAGFMAARAGAMSNANLDSVQQAYEKALIPLYGGGRNSGELAEALAKVKSDIADNVQIELLNPTQESFQDWNDSALQNTMGGGKRVIPNGGLAFKSTDIRPNSGQSIQDANLIKLRITHGYEPKVPLIKSIYTKYLQWMDNGTDTFHTQVLNQGRIPVVSHVTLQMQSDAIEPASPISIPGTGNNGNPINPGDPPVVSTQPPNCLTIGCTVANTPVTPTDPGGGGNGGGSGCTDGFCVICPSEKII
jgi:uncharacterized membrane protein (UPF0127 family)